MSAGPHGAGQPLLTEADTRRAHSLLASLEADLLSAEARDQGTALGQAWVLAQKSAQDAAQDSAQNSALDPTLEARLGPLLDRARSLPPSGPWDARALPFTLQSLGAQPPDPSITRDTEIEAELRALSDPLDDESLARAVYLGRRLRQRPPAEQEAFLHQVTPRAYPGAHLNAVQGLAGLLGVLVEGHVRLGWPLHSLAPLRDRVLGGLRFALGPEDHLDFDAPWQGDPRIDPLAGEAQPRLRLTLGGHLGAWVLLRRLQAEQPDFFPPSACADLTRCLALLTDFSYLVHKRLGYAATGLLEASLLSGAAGALLAFQQLHQLTGEEAHRLNARLWARRLMDLLELSPETRGRIRRGTAEGFGLRFPFDRSLAHGSAGVWLALQGALKPGEGAAWWGLVG